MIACESGRFTRSYDRGGCRRIHKLRSSLVLHERSEGPRLFDVTFSEVYYSVADCYPQAVNGYANELATITVFNLGFPGPVRVA